MEIETITLQINSEYCKLITVQAKPYSNIRITNLVFLTDSLRPCKRCRTRGLFEYPYGVDDCIACDGKGWLPPLPPDDQNDEE